MKPTTKSLAAMRLGQALQFLNWNVFKTNYNQFRADMKEDLQTLELDIQIPETIAEFEQRRDEIFGQILKHLKRERTILGRDVYGLTLYYFGYLPLQLVTYAAWGLDEYEDLLWLFKGVLTDMGIDGEYESIKHIVDTETKWLSEQSARYEGEMRIEDVGKATQRLVNLVASLWSAAEKHDLPVKFSRFPYYSVFISYSFADDEFCQKLYNALSEAGIRTWFATHDMKPGQKIHHQIYGAIEKYDKLLLVLSDASMKSDWVGTELYKARQRERSEGVQMLFPIRLVPFEKVEAWTSFDADSGRDLAREIREYYIPDFSKWRDESAFGEKVKGLIDSLMMVTTVNGDSPTRDDTPST